MRGALKSNYCSKGHKLTAKNVYHKKNGQRECRLCSQRRAAGQTIANRVRIANELEYRAQMAREVLKGKRPGYLESKRLKATQQKEPADA